MNIFSFKGRAKRSEYWSVKLPLLFLINMIGMIPEDAYDNLIISIGLIVLLILIFWIEIAVNTRRCHDLGHNGFWQLIPFYGIWMCFVAGQNCDNSYGPADHNQLIL